MKDILIILKVFQNQVIVEEALIILLLDRATIIVILDRKVLLKKRGI